MSLLGQAAIAMWWDMAPAVRTEFEDWHAHEHFPERLAIPGFLRGARWSSTTGEGCFVMYELATYETLTSPAYVERLNNPTPWSVKMMPHHRGMVRSQCRVVQSHGSGVAGWLATLRLSPAAERVTDLRETLRQKLTAMPKQPGLTSAHLLLTETPTAEKTKEQVIRGADAVADWIVLVSGYDRQAVEDTSRNILETSASTIRSSKRDIFCLAYTLTAEDAGR